METLFAALHSLELETIETGTNRDELHIAISLEARGQELRARLLSLKHDGFPLTLATRLRKEGDYMLIGLKVEECARLAGLLGLEKSS